MALPDFPEIDDTVLGAIAETHSLKSRTARRLPQVGTFNAIYAFADDGLILRVPRNHPRFVLATRNEAIAVPLAVAAGVRTPRLAHYDATLSLLPVPYALYEHVAGVNLERTMRDPAEASEVWAELGRDLARLHASVARYGPAAGIEPYEMKTDPRPLPAIIATAGYFTATEADWLERWLDRLAIPALAEHPSRFLHGDTQSANLIVTEGTLEYTAVIDWGACLWGDVAYDFGGIPLRAVPAMLAGYRETAPGDETIEARILWYHLTIGLHQLRGTPKPDWSWGERPMTVLLDVLRFFTTVEDDRWRRWGP